MSQLRVTARQREIMALVMTGAGGGDWLDISQLQEALGGTKSLQALQCSIRFLAAHLMLMKEYQTRRGRKRLVLVPTAAGFARFR